MDKQANIEKKVYFIGIGGIGMSALARYCLAQDFQVAGYDKSMHAVSKMLMKEGAQLNFQDDLKAIPQQFLSSDTLVIYTPAVPKNHQHLLYFKENGNRVLKRAEFLGQISKQFNCLAVAGTHGKTTTSAMLSHILVSLAANPWSFLGGIANNLNSNFRLGDSDYMVLEADEFDRSFLKLSPKTLLISTIEADHLDIYGNEQALKEAFQDLLHLCMVNDGTSIAHENVPIKAKYSYGSKDADYQILSREIDQGFQVLHLKSPEGEAQAKLAMPGLHNAENALGALAMAHLNGFAWADCCQTLESFTGVYRRFDIHFSNENHAFIDDYAHHPTEIKAAIDGFRQLHPDLKLSLVFQPHLFSRTKDFMQEFAEALSLADSLILLPIYPARELPIEGIDSEVLLEKVKDVKDKVFIQKEDLTEYLIEKNLEGLMTLGAGDIDALVPGIAENLTKKWNENRVA